MSEPRKATDVLISLENKVDVLLGLVRSTDLNIKILSNKLNDVMKKMEEVQSAPRFTVETVQTATKPVMPPTFTQLPPGDPERNIPIMAESVIPQTSAPQGFRRTSRPETYTNEKENQMPIQLPAGIQGIQPPREQLPAPPLGRTTSDVLVAPTPVKKVPPSVQPITMIEQPEPVALQGQIPVVQRCVDANGKSIFLAKVEVIDLNTKQVVHETNSNATGKWMGAFSIGSYRAIIRKRVALTKEKIETTFDFKVDGTVTKLELPLLVIK
jgi:hypothetical protein